MRETAQGYQITRFSNTAQLSIGMIVDRERVSQWCAMPRVQVDILPPVENDENDALLKQDELVVSTVETEFDGESGGGVLAAAREFDALAFDLAGELAWVDVGTLAIATTPGNGKDNLGTLGIQGNIQRSQAIATVRRNAAKEMGLDADEIGKTSYRAANLPVLKAFAKILKPAAEIQPF